MRLLLDTHVFIWMSDQPEKLSPVLDRILIAQAIFEGIGLISADPVFSRYSLPILW